MQPYCADGKQNHDETGIDCGGICGKCKGRLKSQSSNTVIMSINLTTITAVLVSLYLYL
jgi:hypothetical protein